MQLHLELRTNNAFCLTLSTLVIQPRQIVIERANVQSLALRMEQKGNTKCFDDEPALLEPVPLKPSSYFVRRLPVVASAAFC